MFDMPSGSFPNYNHDKYGDNPGQLWTADDQCRILLRDRKAYAFISNDLSVGLNFLIYSNLKFQWNFFVWQSICDTMKCRTPNRDGYFNSGPALAGTVCGNGKVKN